MTVLTNTQDEPIDYTPQVAGMVLEPDATIELEGFGIDIDLSQRTRYTFFTTLIGETLDGTNMCNGFDFLECTIGFNLNPVFPTDLPTPSPTITPFPTQNAEVTSCDIASDITCTVKSLEGLSCDQIKAPAGNSCPADSELLVAYLKYDGSLGSSIYLEVVCDKSTTYIKQGVQSDETFAFRTRANACEEVSFLVYDEVEGNLLQETPVATGCPGPWTLGSTIANVFTLDAFIDTKDDGVSFGIFIDEVEVQLEYIAVNTGQFPLSIVEGTISNVYATSEASSIASALVEGLPLTLAPRSQQVLRTETEIIRMVGRAGDVTTYSFDLSAITANAFALPCGDETSQTFAL